MLPVVILVNCGSTTSLVDRLSAPASLVMTTLYMPAFASCTLVRTSDRLVAPGILAPAIRHWYRSIDEPAELTRKVTVAPRLTDVGSAEACATVNVAVSLWIAPAAFATTT